MKHSNWNDHSSFEQQIERRTLGITTFVSVVLFITLTLYLVVSSVVATSDSLARKIDMDRGLVVQSARIGDVFFLKKYIASFTESDSIVAAGIIGPDTNWLVRAPDKIVIDDSISLEWSAFTYSVSVPLEANRSYVFIYRIRVHFGITLIPLVLSLLIGILILVVLRQFRGLLMTIDRQRGELKDKEVLEEKIKISRQVAHDIKSPIGALKTAASAVEGNPETAGRLITKAVERIDQIVEDLSLESQFASLNNENRQDFLLKKILVHLVDEKELEYGHKLNFHTDFTTLPSDQMVIGNGSSITRALSNIINNALEASTKIPADIWIKANIHKEEVEIQIVDQGKGMTEQQLSRALDYGFSSGKIRGSGLGLSQARDCFSEAGGRIEIYSRPNEGTKVCLFLRVC